MRCYFEPHRDHDRDRQEDDSADVTAGLPAALLQRHGASFLDPARAAMIQDGPVPRPAVYRDKTLLVPGPLLQNPKSRRALDAELAEIGLRLVVPSEAGQEVARLAQAADASGELAARLAQLPRTVVLAPARNDKTRRAPVVVDAWVALQTLRAAAAAKRHPELSQESVRGISLEHLLVGSGLTPPATQGHGITGHGITSTDSYLFGGCDARAPVAVCMQLPARERSVDEIRTRYGRRPVIMTLDTGVREQPWLDVLADPAHPGSYQTIPDGFVSVDADMQGLIRKHSEDLAQAGDQPRQVIRGPWDRPFTDDPLIGQLTTDVGHGTFIAGIARQIVPDARVLSVRIMHSDGVAYEGNLLFALQLLAARVAAATASGGDMAQMVDVLSLSLGYFSETLSDASYTAGLWNAIDILLGMGIAVTASAGNYSTSRRCYPAAFADRKPAQHPAAPLISVGALNPNGSKALFSDDGPWVRAWATGAAIISTFPVDLNGSREPQVRPAHPSGDMRESLDPDNYKDGFAVWSGTSFSAPLVAAQLAGELLAGADGPNGQRLDQGGTDAAVSRITRALQNLGWPG